MLLCSSMRGKRAPPKATILAIYRQHSKGLGIQTAETAVILDSARAFLCDTPLSLTTETALRRELGDDAAKAGWWIFAARNALQEMDEAEAGRFCFCRSVWHFVQNKALFADQPLPTSPIGRGLADPRSCPGHPLALLKPARRSSAEPW
tara:strand:+ start:49 stop:495 length:447 start_codon:yes stop_codon:yes gene_type:complete